MPKNDDAMERLVEEIRLLWCEECSDGPQRLDYNPEFDDACGSGAEEVCGEVAKKVLAHILKAVKEK